MSIMTIEKLREAQAQLKELNGKLTDWSGIFVRNPHLTITRSRERTTRERWLGLPWQPWRHYATWQEPDPRMYVMEMPNINVHSCLQFGTHTVVVGHPDTIDEVEIVLENQR